MTNNTQRIVVFGDRITDVHLLKPQQPSSLRHDALREALQIETPGGADFLVRLLQGLYPETIVTNADALQKAVKVYQIWREFPTRRGEKSKKAFRVEQVVGRSTEPANYMAFPRLDAADEADLLLLDSLGLGCLHQACQGDPPPLASLAKGFKGKHIVFKLSSMRDGLPHWDGDETLYKKLTVVVSAASLRERGAVISRGLSWDRTVEETVDEMRSGISRQDLGRCRRVVVLYSLEGVAVFERKSDDKPLALCRFVYDPKEGEGSTGAQHEGYMFGNLTLLTAALVGHLIDPLGYPLYSALCLALRVMCNQLAEGLPLHEDKNDGKKYPDPSRVAREQETLGLPYSLKSSNPHAPKDADPAKAEAAARKKLADKLKENLNAFATAFRHDLLDGHPGGDKDAEFHCNLLADAAGYSKGYMAAKAFQVVLNGPDSALQGVPSAVYGNFRTVDREEIERINAVRKAILSYRDDPTDKKPLSLAVFGPPGAGKSFAVKELAKTLGFDKADMIEFNLSQFQVDNQTQLHEAFHQVRDATIRGGIPLVFWDEFDASNYRWLPDFLAPMQDAIFTAGSNNHPFGKAIFVFAGGVNPSFESFELKHKDTDGKFKQASRDLKIPDFISRLRGYVNIKGPNPVKTDKNEDHEYLIRRALLLRVFLQSALGRGDSELLPVSAPLVQAFLGVKEYFHGARSMEALVRMCERQNMDYLGESALPPDEPMGIHVDVKDFRGRLSETALSADMIETIARASQQGWMAQKKADGYKHGRERCDVGPLKTHPLLLDYDKLAEGDKQANRCTALVTLAKFAEAGIEIAHKSHKPMASAGLGESEMATARSRLYRIEHDVWLRDHLLHGYIHGEVTDDELRVHNCVKKFNELSEEEQRLDKAIIDAVWHSLQSQGYLIRKASDSLAPSKAAR